MEAINFTCPIIIWEIEGGFGHTYSFMWFIVISKALNPSKLSDQKVAKFFIEWTFLLTD